MATKLVSQRVATVHEGTDEYNFPHSLVAPLIWGELRVGSTLTVAPGQWAGVPAPVKSYQWMRDGIPVPGATGLNYLLTFSDNAKQISCRVFATSSLGQTWLDAVATSLISGPPTVPVVTQVATLSGISRVGEMLTATDAKFSGNPVPTITRQWLAAGVQIPGYFGLTYVIAPEDFGKTISFVCRATNPGGTVASTVSTATPVAQSSLSEVTDINTQDNQIVEDAPVGALVGITARATEVGATITYSLPGDAGGRFAIDPNTGVITLARAGMLSFANTPSLVVTARAVSSTGATNAADFTISVRQGNGILSEIVDANTGPSIVTEGAGNGTLVGITAQANHPGFTVTYSLSVNPDNRFAINPTTGVVSVANGTLLSYAAAQSHIIRVLATSSDGLSTKTRDFQIAVQSAGFTRPSVLPNQTLAVIETAAVGTVVGTIQAYPNGFPITAFSFTTSVPFTIDAGGVVRVGSALNYEVTSSYVTSARATNSAGQSDPTPVTINVTNVNDAAPVIAAGQTFSVQTGLPIGTTVGWLLANDPDSPITGYSITAGNTGNAFSITAAGELKTAAVLNRAVTASYTLTFTATDGAQTSAAVTAKVSVLAAPATSKPIVPAVSASALLTRVGDYWHSGNPFAVGALQQGPEPDQYEQSTGGFLQQDGKLAARLTGRWPYNKQPLVKALPSVVHGTLPGYGLLNNKPGGIGWTNPPPSGQESGNTHPGIWTPKQFPLGSYAIDLKFEALQTSGRGALIVRAFCAAQQAQENSFNDNQVTHELIISLSSWGGYGNHPSGRDAFWYDHLWTSPQGIQFAVYASKTYDMVGGVAGPNHAKLLPNYGSSGWKRIIFQPVNMPLQVTRLELADIFNHILDRQDVAGTPWATGNEWLMSTEIGVEAIEGTYDVTLWDLKMDLGAAGAPPVSFTSSALANVVEGSTVAKQITTDSDATFSLVGGSDQARFALTSNNLRSATLSFLAPPSFSSPTDSDANNTYVAIVRATGLQSQWTEQTLTITVLDDNVQVERASVGRIELEAPNPTAQIAAVSVVGPATRVGGASPFIFTAPTAVAGTTLLLGLSVHGTGTLTDYDNTILSVTMAGVTWTKLADAHSPAPKAMGCEIWKGEVATAGATQIMVGVAPSLVNLSASLLVLSGTGGNLAVVGTPQAVERYTDPTHEMGTATATAGAPGVLLGLYVADPWFHSAPITFTDPAGMARVGAYTENGAQIPPHWFGYRLLDGSTTSFSPTLNVSAGNDWGQVSLLLAISGAPALTAPVNTTLPSVTGTTQVGQTLVGANGVWTNSPTSFAVAWERSANGTSGWVAISGATTSSYTLVSADLNQYLRYRVTATNAAGSSSAAYSAATSQVVAAPSGLTVPQVKSPVTQYYSNSTFVLTLGSAVAAGQTIFLAVGLHTSTNALFNSILTSVVMTGVTWTLVDAAPIASGSVGMRLYKGEVTTGGATAITINKSSSDCSLTAGALVVANGANNLASHGTPVKTTRFNDVTHEMGTLTSIPARQAIVLVAYMSDPWAYSSTPTYTAPSGYTAASVFNSHVGNLPQLWFGYKLMSAGGTESPVLTISAGNGNGQQGILAAMVMPA